MNTFVNAVKNQEARTENNMKARASTASACVDFFFKSAASRGKNIVPAFVAALNENEDVALRIAQWLRDVRGGAGERELFRQILLNLEQTRPELAKKLVVKVPELGRWDDLLVFKTPALKDAAFRMIGNAIQEGNGLCAKWMPRQGETARELRGFFDVTPKQWRKTLVRLTKVVEQQMCANQWDTINFSHVPSLASARYKKAFNRHTPKYAEYVTKVVRGEEKVNAKAVYPYDVLKGISPAGYSVRYDATEIALIREQWNALENFVGDASILPMVDVSGSMTCRVGGNVMLTCLDVAVSLGLYLADKNKGAFKDTFLTFSGRPELLHLRGDIIAKMQQMVTSQWQSNTNLVAAIQKVLTTAIAGKVPASDMPGMLLVLSDMQFDYCAKFDDSAMESFRRQYATAGYEMPKIVFWNINAYDNVPVKFNESGVALVSGFSPAIMRSLLSDRIQEFTPEAIMLDAVMVDRYAI